MSHDARNVADALIERASQNGRPLTPMQIIKLVYISHGWMLGLYDRPLITQPVEAWKYGPVVNDVYQTFKAYGGSHVQDTIGSDREVFDAIEADLLDQVESKYGGLSGIALSRMTHAPGTPWYTIWNMDGQNAVIPNDLIEEHYAQKARAAKRAKAGIDQ